MSEWQFWMLFALIVIGIFATGRWIGDASDSTTKKMDELLSELKDIKLTLDRR